MADIRSNVGLSSSQQIVGVESTEVVAVRVEGDDGTEKLVFDLTQ